MGPSTQVRPGFRSPGEKSGMGTNLVAMGSDINALQKCHLKGGVGVKTEGHHRI